MTDQTFTEEELQTIAVVDKQLEAYNARDIERFVAMYHDEVEVYSFASGLEKAGLQYKGKEILRQTYTPFFASLQYLHASSLKRIVHGRFLVYHEFFEMAREPEGDPNQDRSSMKVICTYEVEDGLIRRMTFSGQSHD